MLAQSLHQLSFGCFKEWQFPLCCRVVLCRVAHELNCLVAVESVGAQARWGLHAGEPAQPCSSLLLFQTLTGEELKLHVSSSNVVLFSFNLTTGTIIPSQSGYDLQVSDLPVGNGTEHSVGLTSTEVKENPTGFHHVSFEAMGKLSGWVTHLCCTAGCQGNQ